jgi:NRAMP (natural resistance-associated macrophage protein)-like metal ion transporter
MRLRIGPGALVTAAFIGPGTVTTCTLAGIRSGTTLLWALTFAVVGTIVLQEMAARLGTVTGQGLGEALRQLVTGKTARAALLVLVLIAIGGGNAAYQTGNLLGAALGVQVIVGGTAKLWAIMIASLATVVLATGHYRLIERVLVALVVVMALVFLATAAAVSPDWARIAHDLVVPSVPEGSVLIALGLIGTTIVPYNLFLHANATAERFADGPVEHRLRNARADLSITVVLGGLVSMAIVVTAAASGVDATTVSSAGQMAQQLTPLLGAWATTVFAIGLFAAGMTSAITAPMAAAWAVAGVFGWPRDLRSPRLRGVWGAVMLAGVLIALTGVQPIVAILSAQAANGILLPVIAGFLLYAMNQRALLGVHVNRWRTNAAGAVVVVVAITLGTRALLTVLERIRDI